LNAVERQVAADTPIHVVLDNYATHKHPKVLAWLARHPRWTFHFTPTSASWLNAVENFFSKMTRQRIRRGVFRSIADLQAAINLNPAVGCCAMAPNRWKPSRWGQKRRVWRFTRRVSNLRLKHGRRSPTPTPVGFTWSGTRRRR